MSLVPTSNVRLYSGVPLDMTHENIFISNSEGAVLSALSQYQIFAQSELTYIKAENNKVRIEGNAESLYNADYISFRNSGFGDKTFFGFVTKVEYLNNNTVEITFIIDNITTWLPYCSFSSTFIERTHTSTDNYFEHLIPENFETGELIRNSSDTVDFSATNYVMLATMTPQKQPASEYGIINGTFCGLVYNYYSSLGELVDELAQYIGVEGLEDAIVAIYQTPARLNPSNAYGDMTATTVDSSLFAFNYGDGTLDGYTPRNKKLFSFPFVQIIASNSEGGVAIYKPELWNTINDVGHFGCRGVNFPVPKALCYPLNYGKGQQSSVDYGIIMSDFPTCACAGNTYSRWWAQNKNSVTNDAQYTLKQNELSFYSNSLSSFGKAITGNVLGVAQGALTSIGQINNSQNIIDSLVAKKTDLQNTPPQVIGQLNSGSLFTGMNEKRFRFSKATIRREIAESIDDYFDLFGYAVNKVQAVNLNVRPHWTYIKTVSCNVRGSAPSDSRTEINKIFNSGVRVWNTMNEIGNYSLNNGV